MSCIAASLVAWSAALRILTAIRGPRNLLAFIRAELFGSWVQGFLTILAVVGGAGLYFSATELYSRLVGEFLVGHEQVVAYLALTYCASFLAFVGWFAVYRRVQLVIDRERDQRSLIAKIHHEMAEIVRSAAIGPRGGGLSELRKIGRIEALLKGELPRYLESKFGRDDISIAVKYACGDETGTHKLTALFRRCCQNEHCRLDDMGLDDSVVFAKFRNADRSLRRIIICDTRELSTLAAVGEEEKRRNEKYRNYAKDCGFRSVLAFPLRTPKSADQNLEINAFRGFISFDCPYPNAFEALFDVRMFKTRDNDGSHCEDTKDLDFFFGLADSLATLALLFDEESATCAKDTAPAEAINHATA